MPGRLQDEYVGLDWNQQTILYALTMATSTLHFILTSQKLKTVFALLLEVKQAYSIVGKDNLHPIIEAL